MRTRGRWACSRDAHLAHARMFGPRQMIMRREERAIGEGSRRPSAWEKSVGGAVDFTKTPLLTGFVTEEILVVVSRDPHRVMSEVGLSR